MLSWFDFEVGSLLSTCRTVSSDESLEIDGVRLADNLPIVPRCHLE